MTFPTMPAGGFDFFLMSSTVKDLLFENPERNSYFQGQLFWTGYPIKSIPYHRMARASENISRWTFAKKLKQTIDVVLGFSYAPVRAATVVGGSVAGLGFLYAIWVFFRGLLGLTPTGYAPIMVVILILGGLQLAMIGIVGEYVWRTLDEVRGRPKYIIAESLENPI